MFIRYSRVIETMLSENFRYDKKYKNEWLNKYLIWNSFYQFIHNTIQNFIRYKLQHTY